MNIVLCKSYGFKAAVWIGTRNPGAAAAPRISYFRGFLPSGKRFSRQIFFKIDCLGLGKLFYYSDANFRFW